ncbi:oxidoreductase short-chain dehydrogenase/reductase family [Penicillium subrubescens]|uniref:Versicolorin reductase n=1 Tax=Penicillium subrubescens TaxID=1316194 RepID=A0A1Q5UPW2_9EURO|nr:oxidoreductase short-chain dehydrogenase/reductase family [Penicillium subrubescens]KAJ5904845.1 oxidoreductase short-chain dehydrogenase/reductase family [Penicillium subrubescens]OKP14511.1 hypothetical protein PENSUB_13979 [Penicillium subrubescens]
MSLSGLVVVVVGASKGIGKEIALRAGADGAKVVINYMSDTKAATAIVAQLGHERAIAVQADVSNSTEVDGLIQVTVAKFGRIDILIPNAAYVPEKDLRNVTEEDFDRAFAVNVKGPCFLAKVGSPKSFRFASRNTFSGSVLWQLPFESEIMLTTFQKALPHMTPGSKIIFISTDMTDASVIQPQFLLYVSTKGAMNQMVKVLARDLASSGIRVNAISPGATSTDSFHRVVDESKERILASHNPFNRIAHAEEIAAGVSLLWGKDSDWISGQVLKVNGGSIV